MVGPSPSDYAAKAYLVLDSIRLGRSDAALVRVTTPLPDGLAAADARARDFARTLNALCITTFRYDHHACRSGDSDEPHSSDDLGLLARPGQGAADYVKSGDRYLSAGKHAEAIIEYRNAVKLHRSGRTLG